MPVVLIAVHFPYLQLVPILEPYAQRGENPTRRNKHFHQNAEDFEFHVDVLPTEVGVQEKDFYVGHILCCLRRGGWEITVPKLDKAYLTTRMQLQTDIKRTKQEIKALEDRIERIENVISNFKLAYERTFEVLGELQNVI